DRSIGVKKALITPSMYAAREKGPLRFWHNHPSTGSISGDDWHVPSELENVEIVAVTVSGTLYVGRMAHWDDVLSPVLKIFPRLAADVEFFMSDFAKKKDCLLLHTNMEHLQGHILNLSMSKCDVVQYACTLSAVDQDLYDAGVIQRLVPAALEYAED